MSFNPQKHLTQVKGKDYLEVKWRLVWFREEHPNYRIDTNFLQLDIDQGVAICQATIYDDEGKPLATGTKTEYKNKFFDYVEKSETGAIGRALAALGFGTQFAPELEEGDRIVDSPVQGEKSDDTDYIAKIRKIYMNNPDEIAPAIMEFLDSNGYDKDLDNVGKLNKKEAKKLHEDLTS